MGSILRHKTLVEQAIEETRSVKEALEFLGLRAAGGNYKSFYRWCETHGLTPKHGTPELRLEGLSRSREERRIPDELVFCENSTYCRQSLKNRIIKENLLIYQCQSCGLNSEWNGKILSLQLSHKNGVYNDNRLENLEFLCPNCHSQTDDFAGKSTRRPKVEKPWKHYYPLNSRTHTRKSQRPEYKELIEQINRLGYSATGRLHGVSDNAIRKWIKHYKKHGPVA